ncbi:unnamed protein product [Moneuplotes crassus]|uniref:Uncharacterized protein n=1 Tax=Euplotes crassus TaxID=5936 RepID=A0AAD1XPG8_EUPCR|nr:unnamed protein product [Moneuplotes crassus]
MHSVRQSRGLPLSGKCFSVINYHCCSGENFYNDCDYSVRSSWTCNNEAKYIGGQYGVYLNCPTNYEICGERKISFLSENSEVISASSIPADQVCVYELELEDSHIYDSFRLSSSDIKNSKILLFSNPYLTDYIFEGELQFLENPNEARKEILPTKYGASIIKILVLPQNGNVGSFSLSVNAFDSKKRGGSSFNWPIYLPIMLGGGMIIANTILYILYKRRKRNQERARLASRLQNNHINDPNSAHQSLIDDQDRTEESSQDFIHHQIHIPH